MQRKAVLTGLVMALMLSALTAVSQCRAGLFDSLFRKDRNLLKKDSDLLRKVERRPPCENCEFGFNGTTWRPWGTCCESTQPGYSSLPCTNNTTSPYPSPESYGTPHPYGVPSGTYESPPHRAPVDSDYHPEIRDPSGLVIPDAYPADDPHVPILPPFERAPFDATSEEPVPTLPVPPFNLTPPDTATPSVDPSGQPAPLFNDGGTTFQGPVPDLTSPDSLLIPDSRESTPPVPLPSVPSTTTPATVPLPAPSVPALPEAGPQTTGVPRTWQPMSYARTRSQPRDQRRPTTQPQSSGWRVMPGFYGPQQSTRHSDRVTFVPRPGR